MATIFRPLPRHQTVLHLFQQPNQHQQEQHPLQNADLLAAAGLSADQYDDSMDESFNHSIVSQDQVPDHIEDGDVSLATTLSLNSPASPPSFQHMESSPYGMDICSPSPGHPLFGQRDSLNLFGNDPSRVPQSFGKELSKESDFLLPPRSNLPSSLLSRLTAGEKNSSPMSTGSVRSNGSVRSVRSGSIRSGKVGSIKSTAGSKDTSVGKGRVPSRNAIPSAWMNPQSGLGLPTSKTADSSFGSIPSIDLHSPQNDDEVGDISMEDAMEVDSPLQTRRPPKAELKPRPLSLFIPPSSSFDITAQGDGSANSPVPRSTVAGYPNQDAFGAHFYDTPEVQRTAVPYGSGADEFGFRLNNPFGAAGEVPSSPVTSPSLDRNRRCLSAVIPTSFSLASAASIDSGSESSSQRGPLSAHPLNGRNGLAGGQTSRIPKYTANRPALSTVVHHNKNSPNEVHSANVVPSARMASLNPRRAFSAFIKPEQLGAAPYPGARGTRMNNGLPKGRVVSMLETVGGGDDTDDTFSGAENTFDSPSAGRALGGRRVRSKGMLNEGAGQKFGSLKSRLPTSNLPTHTRIGSNPSNPSPLKPLLPFGDGEHSGKILPCHSVKDDGLMRISPSTMRDLLSGAYNAQISSYQIIDCRFEYEFKGGHVTGAVNLNKDEEIERYLFTDVEQRGQLPPPSQSGDAITKKHVLIFHCEFSAKRGPTFAKHFRAKDRTKNQIEYPKLHYPELYILEGGYCSFYSAHPELCEPRGYVQMDAPQHSQARAADLGQFRKWNRTRSYTYGDLNQPLAPNRSGIRPSQSAGNNQYQRSTMPPTNERMLNVMGSHSRPQSFHELHTLEEDHTAPDGEGAENQEEDEGQEDHQDQDDAASTGTLTDCEIEAQYEAFAEDDDLEASLGLSASVIPTPASHPPESQEEGQAEEEEDDDDLGHVDLSPCVIAEIKKGKRAGKPFFGRAFKPLSFGKPLGLSLLPPNRARGMERTASSIV